MKRIQAKKHEIGTYEIDKISLTCFDDKRFVLDDRVNTLAYFHKDCHKKDCNCNFLYKRYFKYDIHKQKHFK